MTIRFTLNGEQRQASVEPQKRLSQVLREDLGCLDVKIGCNAGDCGACTVLVDGAALCACTTAAGRVDGCTVETARGLVTADVTGRALAQAFHAHGAAQCGICTPGMITTAVSLLRNGDSADEMAVRDGLGGVLCRCTGYRKIIDAVLDAAGAGHARSIPGPGHAGETIRRLDGMAKIEGTELFGDDVAPPGSLVVRVVRSPFAHAAFSLGDIDVWKTSHPGIELILTADDIPGENRFGCIPSFIDQPVFAEGIARFRGDAIAAVVGSPACLEALDLDTFPVRWQELPALTDVSAALADGAVEIQPGRKGNVMCRGFVGKGNPETGFREAAVVAEGDFSTGFVEHAYIEPEAGFARRVGDRLEIHASTQAAYMDRDSMAAIMAMPPERIRIVPTACGGGFGSKLDLSMQPFVGLAAWILNKPVRIAYSRTESMQSTTKRHPSSIHLKVGADGQGRITAIEFDGDFNTGAYASWGPTVANRVPIHASGPYFVPHYGARGRAIHTHCPPSGAFRGFGVPQSSFALETLLDDVANQLGMDRLAFRRLNALQNKQPTATGQVFDKGVGIGACLDALSDPWQRALAMADEFNKTAVAQGSPVRRGVGVASGWYGCGNTSLPNPSTIRAGLRPDGMIVLHQGAIDIGQGANTVISQIFATALGIAVDDIERIGADTDLSPDAGKTSASRQTFVSGNAARLAGESLRRQILRLGNVSDHAVILLESGKLRLTDGHDERLVDLAAGLPVNAHGYVLEAEETYDPQTKPLDVNGQGDPYATYGYAAHLVELDVDTDLGTVHLRKIHAAHDVGKAINPMLVEGQVQGGIAQGIGFALMEEYLPGRTENLHDYLIPTFGDVPDIRTLIVEVEDGHGPFGAKGLGEHVLIPTAPAIINAVRHATGIVIRDLPATPARIMAALRKEGVHERRSP
jgi:CO/xanthine dehydrogenase Mo-binding subunit/aerobic-type carbon monoxide dehydrogenase small subunit (CoxS/CutS family)